MRSSTANAESRVAVYILAAAPSRSLRAAGPRMSGDGHGAIMMPSLRSAGLPAGRLPVLLSDLGRATAQACPSRLGRSPAFRVYDENIRGGGGGGGGFGGEALMKESAVQSGDQQQAS